MSSIIKVKGLSFGYGREAVVHELSFELAMGSFLAVAGPNGVGKTTLLNLLCGLLRPWKGVIEIDGAEAGSYSARELSRKVAVVRQGFVPVFDFTVEEIVSMARAPYVGMLGFESPKDRHTVTEALEMTETTRFAARAVRQLSGGERQRVFIGRALAQDTPILLLDEPTSFLDLKHQVRIYELLKKMQLQKHKSIVAVTHDINLAGQYCDKVLLLGTGEYLWGRPEDILVAEQVEKTFGVEGHSFKLGRGRIFVPLGRGAKDYEAASQASRERNQGQRDGPAL